MKHATINEPPRALRIPAACSTLGIGKSLLYQLAREKKFASCEFLGEPSFQRAKLSVFSGMVHDGPPKAMPGPARLSARLMLRPSRRFRQC
jgi:hypothetical protein